MLPTWYLVDFPIMLSTDGYISVLLLTECIYCLDTNHLVSSDQYSVPLLVIGSEPSIA